MCVVPPLAHLSNPPLEGRMPTKVLVLGIDAASSALVDRWTSDGSLPFLADLLGRGVHGSIHGVDGFYIGSTWPSLYTGRGPASHGFYRMEQLTPGTVDFHHPLELEGGVDGTPFWARASEAGRRVAVMDVPLSRLGRLNGLQSVEWGGHDIVFGFHTLPPEFADRILARHGRYPLPADCDAERSTAEDFEQWVSGLEDAVRTKANITIDVLEQESWDLVTQVFTEAHCVGHQCWHLHDPSHPSHDPEIRSAVGDPIERVYRAIDAAVAEVVRHAGDATVLVFSAHGMSHSRGADFLLPEILVRLGLCDPEPAPPATLGSRVLSAAGHGWARLPKVAREALRPIRNRFGPKEPTPGPRLFGDTTTSRCFPIRNGFPLSGIRLNIAGREPSGVLHPGDEVERFCDELERALLEIVDQRTGQPVVAAVHRTDDLHAGVHRDALPDVLVEWCHLPATGTTAHADGRGSEVRLHSERIGTISGLNTWGRTGEHVRDGWYAAAGPDVPHLSEARAISILDVHPTVCRLLGVSAPDAEGAVVPELAGG
jgi:predicted AlkP superfamily phosphohydrolase/phosphomutase